MIERVLTRCSGLDSEDIEPLMMLLRRFATEAAREEGTDVLRRSRGRDDVAKCRLAKKKTMPKRMPMRMTSTQATTSTQDTKSAQYDGSAPR